MSGSGERERCESGERERVVSGAEEREGVQVGREREREGCEWGECGREM